MNGLNELDELDFSEVEDLMASAGDPTPPQRRRGRPRRASLPVTPLAPSGIPGSEKQPSARGRREAPTPKALVDSIKLMLGLATGAAELVMEIEGLALEAEEAAAIAKPLAKLLKRSKLANQLASRLTSGEAVTELVMALALYGMRVYPLIRYKIEVQAAQAAMMAAARGETTRQARERQAAHHEPTRPAGPLHVPGEQGTAGAAPRFDPGAAGAYGQFAAN